MKVTARDLINFSYCPVLFRTRYNEVEDDDLTDKFYEFVLSCFKYDFEQEGKLSPSAVESLWQEFFFKGKKRKIKEWMPAYNKSLIAINKFYKWYKSVPLTCNMINFSPKNYISGTTLIQPSPCFYVDGEDLTNLNVVYIVPKQYPGDYGLGIQDPYISYPLASFADSFAKSTTFKSLTVTALFHSHNLLGKDAFRIEQFSPDDAYIESAKNTFRSVMTSLNLPLPHNYLGCATCPISKTCEVKKGNE